MMRKIPIILVICSVLFPLLFVFASTEQMKEDVRQLKQPIVAVKEKAVPVVEQEQSVERRDEQPKRVEQPKENEQKKQNIRQAKPVIILDPGHQKKADLTKEASSPKTTKQQVKQRQSATGVTTKKNESIVTLQFAKKLQKQLEKKGYTVLLTRTTQDVQLSNKERASFANEQEATYVITLHADGATSDRRGFYVATPAEKAVSQKKFEASEKLAVAVLRAVSKEDVVFQNGIFYRKDDTLFNWTTAPSISIQLGFLSNAKDDQKMSNTLYLNELAKWVARGVPKAK